MCEDTEQTRLAKIAETIGLDVLTDLADAVRVARSRHPVFAAHHNEAACAVKSEALEWEAQAMMVIRPDGTTNQGRLARSEEEALHLMATLVRYRKREYGGDLHD